MKLAARLRRTVDSGPFGSSSEPEPPDEPTAGSGDSLGLSARPGLAQRIRQAWGLPEAWLGLSGRSLDELVGGRRVETSVGDAYVIEKRHPLHFNHGDRLVGGLFQRDCDHLEGITGDERLRGFDPTDALFLDIEASGLEHGAGTFAFLIGLGWVEETDFVVQQLLLDEPHSERALLELLIEALDRFGYLVSFNGKSYDLSVLGSRLVMNRLFTERECNLKLRPHLDLLHVSRNLYGGLWEDTRLQTLERRALGFERVDDISGALVPTCWYHFLRTGDAGPMAGVVEHNHHDVLSMVTLADRVVRDSAAETDDGRSLVNLGRLLLRRKQVDRARQALDRALEAVATPTWREEGLRLAALAAKRDGDRDAERAHLERLLELAPADRAGWVALAILEEHHAKQPGAALVAARRARAILPDAAVDKRIRRLEARLGRQRDAE